MNAPSPRALGFLVWNPDAGMPTVGHDTYARAAAEAERLAKANPGRTFHVMAPVKGPKTKAAAEAFSDGKREGYEQAKREVIHAEGHVDRLSDELLRLKRRAPAMDGILAGATTFQSIVADCLLWFDGFNAAHAHKEGWERPSTPNRDTLRQLNARLQELAGDQPDFEEVPF